jgi:hypothetical protein
VDIEELLFHIREIEKRARNQRREQALITTKYKILPNSEPLPYNQFLTIFSSRLRSYERERESEILI